MLGALAGTGVATVGAGSAAAAEPAVLGSCATTIQGAAGQPVSLSPSAVVQPVAVRLMTMTDAERAIPRTTLDRIVVLERPG